MGPSGYFMKSPPTQYHDEEARRMTEEFITEHSRTEQEVKGNGKHEVAPEVVRDLPAHG